jgi:hypothetical protein
MIHAPLSAQNAANSTSPPGKFSICTLVSNRGREWIVLPESTDELIIAKPQSGSDNEITGILTALEDVKPASFNLPDPTQLSDYQSSRGL